MKKQITFIVLLALVGAFMFLLEGCGDDPKPNPCAGKKPLNAEFTIQEYLSRPEPYVRSFTTKTDTLIATDTVAGSAKLLFIAKHDSATYEWKIGEDARTWTTKKVALNFNLNGTDVGNVRIRLIARWKPNPQCFPKDDGVDTVYRSLTILADKDNPMYGKFEGYNLSNPTDVFQVELKKLNVSSLLLTNINKGCDPSMVNEGSGFVFEAYMFRRYFFSNAHPVNGTNCNYPEGVMVVSGNGKSVKVTYTTTLDVSTDQKLWLKDTFIGKRVS